jgi:hypothetical protein
MFHSLRPKIECLRFRTRTSFLVGCLALVALSGCTDNISQSGIIGEKIPADTITVVTPDCIGSQRDPRSTLRYGAIVLESRVEEGEFTVKCNNRGKMRDIDIEPYDEEQGIDGDRDNFIVYTKQPGIQLDDNKVDESTMKLSTDSGVPIEDIR